ncbi:MAG: T9SS type A sorting domain-containing protein [Candidatus Kapaibacteriota bacterium]
MKKVFSSVYILLLFSFSICFSKVELVKDSRGTDFWFTFIPNYHNDWFDPSPTGRYSDSLYIFIAAEEETKGTIEYFDRFGNYYSKPFQISDPSQMYIFRIPSYNFALLGFNQSGYLANTGDNLVQTEKVVNTAFHVTSDKEVSVYGLSQGNKTSDAFLVLPTDVLSNRYFVLAYNSDGVKDDRNILRNQSTPSQFAIVAVEDNTQVTIYPKTPTFRYGNQTQRIVLNKGQVYLVQAQITDSNLNSDLTGTEIVASKPIAVFSGHQRATVPLSIRNPGREPSRDILIEQLPPVSTWGKNSIVVPFAKSQREIAAGTNIFRVLAAEDETDVIINGTKVATLNQGGFYEGILDKPYYISSDKPILVGAFKKTCGGDSIYLGDPFFAIMPPVEQYLDEYRVLNAQAFEFGVARVYQEQYVTVIIPKSKWDSFRIDGLSLSLADIVDVPTSDYVYANVRVSDGVHYLKADTTFGVVIYGYGNANSYGYIGGSNFLRLNFLEPQIQTLKTDSCFISKGIAFKNRPQDAPLNKFYIVDSLMQNCELYSFKNTGDTIFFGFRLIDIYQDGKYGIYVSDTMNLTSMVLEEWIPGFTVSLENQKPGELKIIKEAIATGKEFCFGVPLVNYGRFQQTITRMYLKNTQIIPKNFTPITLLPDGDKFVFNFCFTFNVDTSIVDTLVIENDCLGKNVLIVDVTFASDREPPRINIQKDSCLNYIELNISELQSTDKGLQEVKVIENNNCDVSINLKGNVANLVVRIIDFTKDTYFGIVAIDSAGNKIEYRDTIPGFTLSFTKEWENQIDVGRYFVGNLVCFDFPIYNYGNFPIQIDRVYFKGNSQFSVVPSNYPVLIQPKDTFQLTYCFNPTEFGYLKDTLVVEYEPFCKKFEIPFVGEGLEITLESNSKCNVKVSSKLSNLTNRVNRSNLYPNPTTGIIIFEPNDQNLGLNLIKIMDIQGTEILRQNIVIKQGDLLEIDVSKLPSGIYLICVMSENGNVFVTKFEKI